MEINNVDHSVFKRASPTRAFFGAITGIGLVVLGLIGWMIDQSNVCLNGGIVVTGIYCQFLIVRLSRDVAAEQARSENALRRLFAMDCDSLRHWQCPAGASIFEQVFAELFHTRGDRNLLRESLLVSFRSAMLNHAEFTTAISTRNMPSMGMLGTVLGLIFSLTGIAEGVANANNADAMANAILPVVGSMALAFTTTLTAMLLGSLILGAQAHECVTVIGHYFDQIEAQLAAYPFPDQREIDRPESTDDLRINRDETNKGDEDEADA